MQCVNGSASQTSWTDQLDRPAGRTSWTAQLDEPVLLIWSLGQFDYSKIFLSVCTLSQLPSPTKALLIVDKFSSPILNLLNSKTFLMPLVILL